MVLDFMYDRFATEQNYKIQGASLIFLFKPRFENCNSILAHFCFVQIVKCEQRI